MGEQPLFTIKAHVFQLEPELKKSWIPLSSTAVNIQLFHDPIKNIYRILSVEGPKALINSVVTPKMTFTKTSQKFGQWIDFKANVVYGLGFSNDQDLNKFVERFKEIKELTRNSAKSNNHSSTHERSSSVEIVQTARSENSESIEAQLKYENDRLKLALAQSSANARKWEEELQILKNNNARLTTALQESHSNVEEWKKQLQYYKDECARLRLLLNNNNSNDEINANELNKTNKSNNSNDDNTNNNLKDNNNNNNGTKKTNQQKIANDLNKICLTLENICKELNLDVKEQLKCLVNDLN